VNASPQPASALPDLEFVDFAGGRLALIREQGVREHLSLPAALEDLRLTLAAAEDGAVNAPRVRIRSSQPDGAWLHTLRARLDHRGVVGGKDYTSIGFETPAMWATVVSSTTGLPLALIEADYLSRVRTAAVVALATDLLAPPEPHSLAHFGAGKISELLVRAMLHVRPSIRIVLLVRGHPSHGEPGWLHALRSGVEGRLVDAREALSNAEVATTATSSKEPVIPAGTAMPRLRHLNLVGSNHLKRREIDEDLARQCLPPSGFLAADAPEQAAAEAGDFAALAAEGVFSWSALPSLGELVRTASLREQARGANLTAFKSVGVGLMDLIVATGLLQRLGLLAPEA
jgi:ornithine cyclodeaminase/alanine dehydrogenase-like protein (mu-crystallin family)